MWSTRSFTVPEVVKVIKIWLVHLKITLNSLTKMINKHAAAIEDRNPTL